MADHKALSAIITTVTILVTFLGTAYAKPEDNVGAQSGHPSRSASTQKSADGGVVSLGARIGGYGFREPGKGRTAWQSCRMDGFGGFGAFALTRHVFVETGLDFYQATADTVDSGMDRVTLHTQVALGARAFPDAIISPFVQIGGGVDWTRITLLRNNEDSVEWTPGAFVGLGGELNLIRNMRAGATLRMHAMAHPVGYEARSSYNWESDANREGVSTEVEAATQALFFVRFLL